MNRREFIAYQSLLLASSLLPESAFALFESRNWDQYIEVPTYIPPSAIKKYPDPIRREWPRQGTPDFRLIKDHVAGIRPYRRGGFRLQTERWNSAGKIIVHNYGHGGSGITFSWGAAELAVEKLISESNQIRPVAVIGAGVLGLSTAFVLLEKGYPVTIYSDKFHPHITSSVAGGQFAPSLVEIPADVSVNNLILRSWRRFSPLDEKGAGVSYVPNFMGFYGSGFDGFPRDTIPGGQSFYLNRLPFQGPRRSGSYAWTLLIEPTTYLPWLTQQVLNKGCRIRQERFQNRNDVALLPESYVINCLGIGAKNVFQDTKLVGMRGQLVLLQPQNLGYLLSFRGGYAFSRSDAVVLGGTYETGVENPATTPAAYKSILAHNKTFFGLH
jgi:D-amino-acid oxidase